MRGEEQLRAGRLDEALADLQAHVRDNPADPEARIFLFQLLAVLGQWQRALTQLNVIRDLDPHALPMVHTYREALRCEVLRGEIFAGKRSPTVFGEPTDWLALLVQALQLTGTGKYAEGAALREEAFAAAPATAGSIDGQAFEWIADADGRLGPVLEVIMNGQYYWVPFMRIRAVHVEEPADLRDQVWMPAYLTWVNGGEAAALLPTRYPGSQDGSDPALRLARRTEWQEVAPEEYQGAGQRLLATDVAEYPLMDIRHIDLPGEQS